MQWTVVAITFFEFFFFRKFLISFLFSACASVSTRRRASTNLQKKLLELAALQDKIYELRFSSSLPEADLKARLGALLGEMLRLQDQISTGLTQDVADFQQLVAMEGVVPILPVEDSPSGSSFRLSCSTYPLPARSSFLPLEMDSIFLN